ncbi:hypothetical protein C2G38_2072558 [Gigaspora rosea]|uniref:Uncharacterized protein n=1 Tax=Gigaspora rosea TaxID=44941 RepID=A0A397VWZ7_9GLOM|nr:hypothetical protein C2G38_2072558 [Gigaspora rosea]
MRLMDLSLMVGSLLLPRFLYPFIFIFFFVFCLCLLLSCLLFCCCLLSCFFALCFFCLACLLAFLVLLLFQHLTNASFFFS